MTKNNSVLQMVACLSVNGAMPETQLLEDTFGYDEEVDVIPIMLSICL